MTLQTQHTVNAPATLTDEQRQRVSDALENAQSVNTRRNYAGQFHKFRAWCQGEGQSALPASPEVVAAYAAELVAEGKSMSTVRLAVASIVDAHRRVDLESPVNAGVTETLRGLARRVGASQKQAKPLDADALAAIRATAFTPRRSRGGSLESEVFALKRGRLDIALASVLSDAGLRVSEAVQLRWRDVLDTETGAGLVYIERSKTDQAGEGAYVAITPGDTDGAQVAASGLRRDDVCRCAGVRTGDQDDPAGRSAAGGADARALEVTVNAGEVHQGREGA